MQETIVQGVSLLSKERRRRAQIFELALNQDGIEIRRSGEEPRLLSWERVTEWEIEQRRGGALLTLRGGGAVTPLVIPRWKVDELDSLLRAVTSPPPPLGPPLTPEGTVLLAEPGRTRTPEPVAEPHPVAESESGPDLTYEDIVSQHLAPPREAAPVGRVVPAAEEPTEPEAAPEPVVVDVAAADGAPVLLAGGLVWQATEEPLGEIPSLSWPASMDQIEDVATARTASPEPPLAPVAPVGVEFEPLATSRIDRRPSDPWRAGRFPFQTAVTVVLLALLATAVGLVLAQSAGLIHLAFLGSTA
jgi:hypothetical protein